MMPRLTRKTTTPAEPTSNVALREGFRSGLEDAVSRYLRGAGITAEYEPGYLQYTVPSKPSRYTPDFILPNGIVIETKGRFVTKDRQKHILIKEQHPNLDLRFVFSNPNARITKGSPTTYAMWCEKHGFVYSAKTIPAHWLTEPIIETRQSALKALFRRP